MHQNTHFERPKFKKDISPNGTWTPAPLHSPFPFGTFGALIRAPSALDLPPKTEILDPPLLTPEIDQISVKVELMMTGTFVACTLFNGRFSDTRKVPAQY